MKRITLIFAATLIVASTWAMAAQIDQHKIFEHDISIYQGDKADSARTRTDPLSDTKFSGR